MSKRTIVTVPTMHFGSGRTGQLRLSLGKRGRLTLKGETSFSLPEARAFLTQVGWFLEQVSMAGPAGGSASKPTLAHGPSQLDLYAPAHVSTVPNAAAPATVK